MSSNAVNSIEIEFIKYKVTKYAQQKEAIKDEISGKSDIVGVPLGGAHRATALKQLETLRQKLSRLVLRQVKIKQ